MERVTYTARIIGNEQTSAGMQFSEIVAQYDANTQEEVMTWARENVKSGQYAEILLDRPTRKYGRYREIGVVRG